MKLNKLTKPIIALTIIGSLPLSNICYANNMEEINEKFIKGLTPAMREVRIQDIQKKVKLNIEFDVDNLFTPSNVTSEEIDYYLKDTNLRDLGPFYERAELETGINALMLMSLTILESSWGTSRIANDKNNLSGFMAYNKESYENAKHFKSKGDCIMYVAWFLKNNYLSEDGLYYKGKALKDVNSNYCLLDNGDPDYNWYKQINDIANCFIKRMNNKRIHV